MTDTQTQILTAAVPEAAPAKSRRPHRTAPTLQVKLHTLWYPHPVTGLTNQAVRYAHSPRNGKLHVCAHDIAVRVHGASAPNAVNNAVRAINGSGRLSQRTGRGLTRGDIKYFNRNFYAVVDGKREVMTSIGRLREYVGTQHHMIDSGLQGSVAQLLAFIGTNTTLPEIGLAAVARVAVPKKSVRSLRRKELQAEADTPPPQIAQAIMDFSPDLGMPMPPDGCTWHNPQGLTAAEVGVGDGWRLLLAGELTASVADIECRKLKGSDWHTCEIYPSLGAGDAVAAHYNRFAAFRTRQPLPNGLVWPTTPLTSPTSAAVPEAAAVVTSLPMEVVDDAPARPMPSIGNPNCARVQFMDDVPAEYPVVAAKKVTDAGFLNGVSAEVVAAIPESNGGLLPFDLRGNPVRGLVVDGQPAVVGNDLAEALGYADPKDAIRRHCKGAVKRLLPTQGGPQQVVVIFEPDIYRLIIKSKLKEAQEFESLVFNDILPSIRRTGAYVAPGTQLAATTTPAGGSLSVVDVATIVRETVRPLAAEFRELVVDMRKDMLDMRERTQIDIGWLLQRQANTESEITRQAGLRFPALPAPRSLGDVECPRPGLRLLDEPYLTVSGYKQDYCGNILPCHPALFGRRVAELCRERGVDTRELSGGGVGWPDQTGYPLSCLHEVRSTEARRQADDAECQAVATPAGSPLDLPMALAS